MTVTDLPPNSMLLQKARSLAMLSLLCLITACSSCGQSDRSGTEPALVVLADPRTGALFTAPAETAIPAIHPQTGKPTLSRAWYCSKCQTWYPVPPPEVMQRNAKTGKCPKTGAVLQPTGPLPTGVVPLNTGE